MAAQESNPRGLNLRPVRSSSRERLSNAISDAIEIRALLGGASLLLRQAELAGDDRKLRRDILRLARDGMESCESLARAIDVALLELERPLAQSLDSLARLVDLVGGRGSAIIDLFNGMAARDVSDDALQASCLFRMVEGYVGRVTRAIGTAHDELQAAAA